MKAAFLSLFTTIFCSLVFAGDYPPSSNPGFDWSALLDQAGGEKVKFGVSLGSPALYLRNSDVFFVPASTAKLFTAGLALEMLGNSFQYKTEMRWQQSKGGLAYNLQLVGTGDPSWGLSELGETVTSRIATFVKALKDSGVTTLAGEIKFLAENNGWNSVQIPEGWDSGDTDECYGALVGAFNLNLNCASFKITSIGAGNWMQEGLDELPVEFHLVAGAKTVVDLVLKNAANPANGYVLRGIWKEGDTEIIQVPMKDPVHWIRRLFAKELNSAGIAILPASDPIETLEGKTTSILSLPLGELLKPFLKNSINLFGEAFLKTVGEHYSFGNSTQLLESGRMALGSYLQALQVPGEVRIFDGSGLSRKNAVTPVSMLFFLEQLSRAKDFPFIWEALPIAGVDGTIATRMKGSAAEGVLRGKTGSMSGIYNLAGYVPGKVRLIPFVMFTDTKSEFRNPARAAEDRVGIQMVEQMKSLGWHRILEGNQEPYPFFSEHSGDLD